MRMDAKKSTGFKLSVATLAIMNVTAVVSLRGLPAEAVYGPSSAFYYLFAAIVFLTLLLLPKQKRQKRRLSSRLNQKENA